MTLRRCIHGRTERQRCARCNMKIKAERLEGELNGLRIMLEANSGRAEAESVLKMEIGFLEQDIRALNAKVERTP